MTATNENGPRLASRPVGAVSEETSLLDKSGKSTPPRGDQQGGEAVNREELEQVIYERTRDFVSRRVMDCILELIAEEREACAKIAEMPRYLNDTGILTVNPAKSAAAHFIAIAIRSRGEVKP